MIASRLLSIRPNLIWILNKPAIQKNRFVWFLNFHSPLQITVNLLSFIFSFALIIANYSVICLTFVLYLVDNLKLACDGRRANGRQAGFSQSRIRILLSTIKVLELYIMGTSPQLVGIGLGLFYKEIADCLDIPSKTKSS